MVCPMAAMTDAGKMVNPIGVAATGARLERTRRGRGPTLVVVAASIAAVRPEVLGAVANRPRRARALVVGSFTPTGGSAVDFRVFIDAVIEVEMGLTVGRARSPGPT